MSFIILVLVIVQLARIAFKADEIRSEIRDENANAVHPAAHNIRFYAY